MKKIFCTLLYFSAFLGNTQELNILTYNVENLFDTLNTPGKFDEEFTPEGNKHWNTSRYLNKLYLLDSSINLNGIPDIIGLVEVENKTVVVDLLNQRNLSQKSYSIIHSESPDRRGIDCAIAYNKESVSLLKSRVIPLRIDSLPDYATRDILYAKFLIGKKDTLHYFVNHWSSRRGGQEKSEFKRLYASTVLGEICDSIHAKNQRAKLIIMGDFNDMPDNKSITNLTDRDYLKNLTVPENDTIGTYNYRGNWNMLDQCIVSEGLLKGKGKTVKKNYPYIPRDRDFLHTIYKEVSVPFRTYGGKKYLGGISDHLWVQIMIK